MDIVIVNCPLYKCDCAPKITGITFHIFFCTYMEDTKKRFVCIRGNIKQYLTGIVDERGLGNSNFRPYQIIEVTNRLSR